MSCIWVPTSFTLQTSAFGAALNASKKKAVSVSVRRRSYKIRANSISPTQTDNIPLEENTEFKSSFDEYLKAMEFIRTDREKKKPKGSYNRKKQHNDVTVNDDGPRDVQSGEYFGFKGSVFKEENDLPKEMHGDGVKGRKGVHINPQNNAGLDKEVEFVKLKDGARNKIVEDSTRGVPSEVVRRNMSSDDEFKEIRTFPFESFELLDDVQVGPRVSRMEMEERIQNLAKRLNDADMDMPEWMFSKMMRSAQIKFCDHSMLRIIKILGKLGNWKRVLQVVDWLQMHERYKPHKIRYVYTAALDVLGKTRRPIEALNLFCAMQRHKASYPDIVAYHSIAVTLGQAGHMKELFYVIDSMGSMPKNINNEAPEDWDPRLDPDIIVYNAILNACAMRKEWEGAFWVLEKLAQIGEQPSSTTYGLVMEVMLACGKYDLVHEFFRQLQESSAPSVLTYRVVVNTLWREGKPDEAMEAVYDMERRGLIGSASIYYDLARCLCSAGRHEDALMQVDKICKVASKPLVITYTGLIQACLDHGHVNDGASIFNQMQKYCSPNVVTCNIILKAYLRHGMFDDAKELFQKMTQDGHFSSSAVKRRVIPDVHTFNVMIEACIQGKRWSDFVYAYEQMLHHGYHFNTKRHLWMVLQASYAGKVEVVETTWKHLLQSNRIPPPALIKERFRLKIQNNETVEAVSTIACHPSTHQQSFSKEAWLKLLDDNAHIFNKGTVEQVIHEVSVFLSKSESQNLIFQNLLESCMEFVQVEKPVADTNPTDINESPCVHLTVV